MTSLVHPKDVGYYGCRGHVWWVRLGVVPGAQDNALVGLCGNGNWLKVRLKARAQDHKANEALVIFLTELWDLPSRCCVIQRGVHHRVKVVTFSGLTPQASALLGHKLGSYGGVNPTPTP